MTGLNIHVYSKRDDYKISLTGKITIIRGMSGVGKTSLVKALTESSPAYKIEKSDNRYSIQRILGEGKFNTIQALQESGTKNIFIIDDEDLLNKREFVNLYMKDKTNLYLVIDRFSEFGLSNIKSVPFSVYDVYDMKTNGKYHWLEPSFEARVTPDSYFDYAVTEDKSAGLAFLKSYNLGVQSVSGKDNILPTIQRNINNGTILGKKLLVFVDLASYGNYMDSLISHSYYNGGKVSITLLEDYQCFEYLLLKSNLIKYKNTLSVEDIAKYFSKENMYEVLLDNITKGTPYHQPHGSGTRLNKCFVESCCYKTQVKGKHCTKGISGDKKIELFKGTIWEGTFNALMRSKLQTDLDI